MATYPRWAPHVQSRLPPTPPDYQHSYLTPMSAVSADEVPTFFPPPGYPLRQATSTRDFTGKHRHGSLYAPPSTRAVHSRSRPMSGSQDFPLAYGHQMGPQFYGPVAAPILPPIRAADDLPAYQPSYALAHPAPKPKDDKPTGGVAQHLDYEMDLMSSFVAEMSQKLVTQSSSPSSQFRKYVSQILSSTRLPSSTIMLGLFYLQERQKILSHRGADPSAPGTVYRMLTTCLLLGSKFLDDNTFQNRSWAEVSSIPVVELNTMELDWLQDFHWEIHRLMYDASEGFFMWIEHWHAYEKKAQLAQAKEVHKVTPIETNFARHHPAPIPLMSPDGPIPPQYQQRAQYDTQWVRPYMSDYSPPSAPDSGPATPDYYAHTWAYPQPPQSYTRASWTANTVAPHGGPRAQLPAYPSPYHPNHPFGHTAWAGHGVNCGCTLCAKHSTGYYFNGPPGFGLQTVVG